MIGQWYVEKNNSIVGSDINKLTNIAGGLVEVLFLSNEHESNRKFDLYTVKDYKTGQEYHFEDYILQLLYKPIEEAEVVLYARK